MATGVEGRLPSGKAICCWFWSKGSLFLQDGDLCGAGGLAGLWRVTGAGGRVLAPHRDPQNPPISFPSAEYLRKAKTPISCIKAALRRTRESVLALWRSLLLRFHYGNPIKGIGWTLMMAKVGGTECVQSPNFQPPARSPPCGRGAGVGQVAFKSLDGIRRFFLKAVSSPMSRLQRMRRACSLCLHTRCIWRQITLWIFYRAPPHADSVRTAI